MCCGPKGRGMRHRMRARMEEKMRERGLGRHHRHSTGNTAFDEYREEVLAKLEEEREAFDTYLHDLRRAKDREEFESFLAARKAAAERGDDETPASPPADTPPSGGSATL